MTDNGVESVGVKLSKQNRRRKNRTEYVTPSTCITQGGGECLWECIFLRVFWLAGWWMCCCGSLRSRWAQFQHDCQPSELTASGCQQENYGACLVAYSGLIGENSGQRSPPWLITYTSQGDLNYGHCNLIKLGITILSPDKWNSKKRRPP